MYSRHHNLVVALGFQTISPLIKHFHSHIILTKFVYKVSLGYVQKNKRKGTKCMLIINVRCSICRKRNTGTVNFQGMELRQEIKRSHLETFRIYTFSVKKKSSNCSSSFSASLFQHCSESYLDAASTARPTSYIYNFLIYRYSSAARR